MWHLFQIIVFLAVMFTGVYYEWTPNMYVLSGLSFIVALLATVSLAGALDGLRSVLQKRPSNRLPNRRRTF